MKWAMACNMASVLQHEPITLWTQYHGWSGGPTQGSGWDVYMEHQQLCWFPLAIRRAEHRPAIDKANSLVPHSPPSKPPLNVHRPWVGRTTHWKLRISRIFSLHADDRGLVQYNMHKVLLWRREQLYGRHSPRGSASEFRGDEVTDIQIMNMCDNICASVFLMKGTHWLYLIHERVLVTHIHWYDWQKQ